MYLSDKFQISIQELSGLSQITIVIHEAKIIFFPSTNDDSLKTINSTQALLAAFLILIMTGGVFEFGRDLVQGPLCRGEFIFGITG